MPSIMKTLYRLKAFGLALVMTQGTCSLAQSPAPSSVEEPTLDIQRYVIEGENPLSADETSLLLAPFTGPKRTLRQIEEAANAMERAMGERGYAFHRMFVPAQKPSAGEVRLQILGIKLGTVEVIGNEHFTSDNIRRSLTSLKEGAIPEVRTLGRDITTSNANPAKQVTVTFKESSQASAVDAVVKAKDLPPMSFFMNLTGNQLLSGKGSEQDYFRIRGVVQHANLFDRDHVMSLSYSADMEDPSKASLFGAYYQIPLYGHGINLSASVTSSDVDSGRVQQGAGVFDVSGSGLFTALRLTNALDRVNTLQQTLGIGLEDRLFKNSTTFNGVQIQPDVRSRVLSLQYAIRHEPSWGIIAGSVDYAVNIGGGAGNTEVDHVTNGGTKDWDAWRFNVEASMPSARWQYTGRLKGQYAKKSLISGEQFGLGGANSVRGFSDRVVSGDDGYEWSLEAMGPELSDLLFRPVVFVDGGQVHAHAGGMTENLLSAGVGLRLVYRKLQVGLDLAQPVERDSGDLTGSAMRMHLALSYRF